MRLDRFLTVYLFKYLAKIYNRQNGVRIPILMYHSISDEPEKGHPYFWINTSPKRFAEHLRFLYENNYRVISLSEAVHIIESKTLNRKLQGSNSENLATTALINSTKSIDSSNSNNKVNPSKTVVLTFDDGYKDFYTEAFPILQKYGFTSTVFLPTSFIENRTRLGLRNKNHLSWSEVIQLERMGVTFGSHTVTHRQMEFLGKDDIKHEVLESKIAIEEKIGKSIESFSYPFAFPEENSEFKKYLVDALTRYGYQSGVGTIIGTVTNGEDRFFLKRIPINSKDDIRLFIAKLEGDYDWLHIPQYYFKKVKGKLNPFE